MQKLVISGIGPLSPSGAGKEKLWEMLSGGPSVIKEITRFPSVPGAMGGEVDDSDADAHINARKFRRAADVSKYAMAAIELAMNDAGLDSVRGEDSAMVAAITHGALNYTQDYHESLLTGGVEDISPALFSDSVLNAPAGNASICYGIQGAVHTIIGGVSASIKASILACRLLEEDSIQRAAVIATEEINELSFYCRRKFGESIMSEGAGAILIEKDNGEKNSQRYCSISGFSSYLNISDMDKSFRTSVDRALAMAGIKKQDVDFALVDMPPGIHSGYLDNIRQNSISRYTGNAFCVSSIWNIIIAAYILDKGFLPEYFSETGNKADKADNMKNVLVCSLEKTGSAAAMVLTKTA
jgi:3-oxoacyl-(acyl-carrier-protein) synthase